MLSSDKKQRMYFTWDEVVDALILKYKDRFQLESFDGLCRPHHDFLELRLRKVS